MERFKAVEKAMKTKAYSKEGLSAATKLDPKEQAKVAKGEFIGSQVDELEQQIETLEAEGEAIQATMKRGKMHGAKADRMAQIERTIERHKWHQGKLELMRRSLENGGIDVDQVADLEESIRYYVTDNMQSDFMEDDTMYDDLNLEENEDAFGMNIDNDKVSSQDNTSIQGDTPEIETKSVVPPSAPAAASSKGRQSGVEAATSGRRPSAQLKSPLPALATLHTPLPTLSNGSLASTMKPASIPTRPAGEGLKYASAAAAAAASDKLNLGIAPLPPPVGGAGPAASSAQPPAAAAIPAVQASKIASAANSPKPTPAQPSAQSDKSYSPAVSVAAPASSSAAPTAVPAKSDAPQTRRGKNAAAAAAAAAAASAATPAPAEQTEASSKSQTNGFTNGAKHAPEAAASAAEEQERRDEESIYHLPASLQDLVDSFEATKSRPAAITPAADLQQLAMSANSPPEAADSEPPRRYVPDVRYNSTSNYPQEPLPLLDDPRLYNRIDPDTLFYVFYYKQGTYQQYLAAKALKDMSWRFHKQYQTWFQRHEEPKSITEEFEQGTYRFFDYESTWYVSNLARRLYLLALALNPLLTLYLPPSRMNRRKADFKFVYKFLEDDV